jgi:poly(3-hydroxybutyrate) depolymerase
LKRSSAVAILLCALLLVVPALAKVKATRSTFKFEDKNRVYYSFVPDTPGPLPLIVLLHGSGRDGAVMAEAWKDLAAKEHFMIAAPDAYNPALWDSNIDNPLFLHAVVDQMRAIHPVDDSRIYLYGHSGGAVFSLALALIDSEYYAAVAVHAGTLRPENYGLFDLPTRHTPVAIWVGSLDQNFPVADVTETKRAFDAHGFNLELHVLQGQTHNYDNFSEELDSKAWNFLKDKRLSPPNPSNPSTP